MAESITITEADLRAAIRDPRYWMSGHPEREGFAGWVTEGFRALHGPEAKGGSVKVRAYTRRRDGREEHVGAHTPGSAAGWGEGWEWEGIADPGEVLPDLLEPTQMLPFFARPPFYVPQTRPSGTPMRRVPNQSGKDGAKNPPSFAQGRPRFVGESAKNYAERMMNENYGPGRWSLENTGQRREFQQIEKYGNRAFYGIPFIDPGSDEEA
jgi:hypothetical protein